MYLDLSTGLEPLCSRAAHVACLVLVALVATPAQSALVEDGSASLELRNFYHNQDQRQAHAAQSKAQEWAQGAIFRYQSGYTDGLLGVGGDAFGFMGVRLDSGPGRAGSGLLPRDGEGRAEADYGSFGLTAKLRVANTVLKSGVLLPKLSTVQYNDTRLIPQTFKGTWLNSTDIPGLSVDALYLDKTKLRDSSGYEALRLSNTAKRNAKVVSGNPEADHFATLGGSYQWHKGLKTGYAYASLEGIYQQHYLDAQYDLALSPSQTLKFDLRWAKSIGEGGTTVDNTMFGAMVSYRHAAHALALGYQRMSGESGYAYLQGADAYLINFVMLGDFANKDEKSWQARYNYDFAGMGIPGLQFMVRYLHGDDIDTLTPGESAGKEYERDMDLMYVIQSGPLKNVSLRWRNASVRSNFDRAVDENRLIIGYTVALW